MSFIDRHTLMLTKCGKCASMRTIISLTATEKPLTENIFASVKYMSWKQN
jgi:sulfur relay (sulfurtransferase) complex TusBCD TusD component (DsrE family)